MHRPKQSGGRVLQNANWVGKMEGMRRAVLGLMVLLMLAQLGAGAAGRKQESLGEKIVAFCQSKKGEMVGNGECAVLAGAALKTAGARGRGPDRPNKGDYTWGDEIFFIEGAESNPKIEGRPAEIRAGDIIQLRDVKFKGKRPGGTYSMTFPHHTAIVAGVEDGGNTVHIFHQNFGGKKVVMNATYKLRDLKEGWMRFYRPVLKTGA
jgi:hypothetical protein